MTARTILTMSNGIGIDLLDPKPEQIDFASIAEHLAKEKRYNGATPEAEYSVAQHCCVGADAMIAAGLSELDAAAFLLHDGHEALLKDDTTPKKHAIAELAASEFGCLSTEILNAFELLTDRHDTALHTAAGLQWPLTDERRRAVKRYDLIMFVTEWRDLMRDIPHPNWHPYAGIKPLPERIIAWPWAVARDAWLRRANKLFPALRKIEPFKNPPPPADHGSIVPKNI